jgi:hypothetical protein
MAITIRGTVKQVGEVFTKGDFQKKELLLTVDEESRYPQDIPIDFINKDIDLLNVVGPGDKVAIDINFRGNEWNGKHYVSINGWKLSVDKKATAPPPAASPAPAAAPQAVAPDAGADAGDDDLPF